MDSGTTENLNAVWGSSSSDVFAVGDNGRIIHYNGSQWTSMDSGTTHHLHGVWGSSRSDVFAVGDNGTILHVSAPTDTPHGGACDAPIPLYCSDTTDFFYGSNDLGRAAAFDTYGTAQACLGSRPTTGNEVFYRLDCPVTGTVYLRLTPAEADLDLIVIAADSGDPDGGCAPSHCVAASHTSGDTALEELSFDSAQGTTYYAVVDGFAAAASGYTLEILCDKEP